MAAAVVAALAAAQWPKRDSDWAIMGAGMVRKGEELVQVPNMRIRQVCIVPLK